MDEAEATPSWLMRTTFRVFGLGARVLGPLRYGIVDAIAVVSYALQRERRRRTVANYRRALGVNSKSATHLARRSFVEYGRTATDFVWANGMSRNQVMQHSQVTGKEHIDAAVQAGSGAVVVLAHFGSWDMAASIAHTWGLHTTTVMSDVGPPALTEYVGWTRRQQDTEVFREHNAARGLLRAIRKGRFVVLLCDIPEAGPTVSVPFCGGKVLFSSVPAWLALRTGAPILAADCWREGGRYRLHVHPPVDVVSDESEEVVMSRVAAVLEKAIVQHPTQWYPFHKVYVDDVV